MKILIQGGHVIDPASGVDEVRDLWIDGKQIAAVDAFPVEHADRCIDASGCVVMAGGIDLHTHIGGGKLSIARMLLQDQIDAETRQHAIAAAEYEVLPSAGVTAQRYLAMGYTAGFEPAMIPCNARAAHAEMADMPGLTTGGFCLLGNDDLLLRLISESAPQALINDYVAWMVTATRSLAVKVVNAGGISAFKFGQRELDVDQVHPHYGITPADVIRTLARAVNEIGLVHPLHVHCSNLGVPGNIRSTLATIQAADGFPIHLTHAQFHSYDDASDHGMSSAAFQLAEALQQHPNVTIDVGQVMFGQTVTVSADAAHQFANRLHATPKKSAIVDVECEAGCGVVPFRYRRKQYVNALQWAIGLELFLMVDDPSRVFLTTDHPNGAPFTAYPHLIGLLSDRNLRETALAELHPDAKAASSLSGIDREYGLPELAVMTRSAPAEILGLTDHGRLSKGAVADVVIYQRQDDLEAMFRSPRHVLAQGAIVASAGTGGETMLDYEAASQLQHHAIHAVLDFDVANVEKLRQRYNERSTFDMQHLWISDDQWSDFLQGSPIEASTRRRSA